MAARRPRADQKENSFLTDAHTMERYMAEMWIPSMFERSDLRLWQEEGNTFLREKIKDRLAEILGSG